MNILHITRRFWPFIGGVETYIHEISRHLVTAGHQCRVLTLDYDIQDRKHRIAKADVIDGIEIIRIRGIGYYKKPLPLHVPIDQFRWADIVHVHDIRFLYETTLLLRQMCRFKIVLSTHGFLLHSGEWQLVKDCIVPLYYRPTLKRCVDEIICVSRQDYEYFSAWKMNNLNLIENGIDYSRFCAVAAKPSPGSLLYFGRIDVNKGIDLLFECLACIKERAWTLNIVGEGRSEIVERLKAHASTLGIEERIVWHGFVDERQLASLLVQTEICFFPSRYEGFGLTLVEAMAAGCICVANDIPTYRAVIGKMGGGFLTDFCKKEVGASLVKEIMAMPAEEKSRVSSRAQATASTYDWKNKIRDLTTVYEKAINE